MAELNLNFDLFFFNNSSEAASLSVSLVICEVVGLLSMGGEDLRELDLVHAFNLNTFRVEVGRFL